MREEKIQKALDNYFEKGYTCSQAVFCAYAKDIGVDERTAYSLTQGLGGGVGGMQNICGAFSGAVLVISYYCCGGAMDASTKAENFEAVQQAAALFKKEYGSVICRAILRGEKPQPHKCGEKIENAVRIIETILDKKGEKTC